jgi:hypothetical protein
VNPFQVVIAQKVAELPTGSGFGFRVAFLIPALGLWILGTIYHARRTQVPAEAPGSGPGASLDWRDITVLLAIVAAFATYFYGAQRLGWEFNELAALFFVIGVGAGLLRGLGIGRTTEAFVEGFRSMVMAALLVGFARAIYVVLNEGQVVDTIVHGLFTPIAGLPATLSALGMIVLQGAMHVPVPSTSSQAVLTLPLLVPLSDLIGLSRQVTVLSYQYGAGLCDLLTPTNGALMAMLAAAGVRYEDWFRFAIPLCGGLLALGPSTELFPGKLLQHLHVGHSHVAALLLTAAERNERWNSPDPVASGDTGIGLGVELQHQRFTGFSAGKLIQRGRHRLAGPAPVGIEVHQHGNRRAGYRSIEVLVRNLLRPIQPERLSAFRALGSRCQTTQIDAVRGRAEGTRNDDRTG